LKKIKEIKEIKKVKKIKGILERAEMLLVDAAKLGRQPSAAIHVGNNDKRWE
jgi:hypothetical protein